MNLFNDGVAGDALCTIKIEDFRGKISENGKPLPPFKLVGTQEEKTVHKAFFYFFKNTIYLSKQIDGQLVQALQQQKS